MRRIFAILALIVLLPNNEAAAGDKKTPVPGGAFSVPMPKERGYSVDDSLAADDLREDGHPFKLFLVPLQEGQCYRFEVEAKGFDPYLRLLDPRGGYLAGDDDSGGVPDARLRFKATHSGLHRLQVTSLNKDSKGAFTLFLRPDPVADKDVPLKLQAEEIETGKPFKPQEQRLEGGVTAHTFLHRPEGKIVDALWSEDGKKLYTLERAGTVRRFDVDTWTEEARLDLKEKCNNLAWCKLGLVVGAQTHVGEVFLLNPTTFKQIRRMAGLNLTRVAGSPKSNFVVVAGHIEAFRKGLEDAPLDNQGSLWVIDLRGGKAPKTYNDKCVRGLVMPPVQGDLVFTQNTSDGIAAYWVDDLGQLRESTGMYGFAKNGQNLGVSADGETLWLPCPEGNYRRSTEPYEKLGEPPHALFFVNRHTFRGAPEFFHGVGPGCKTAGLDAKTGDVYVHNHQRQLIAFNKQGQRKAELFLGAEQVSAEPLAFHPHPEGGKVLVRFADRLTLVDLSRASQAKSSPLLDAPGTRRLLFSSVGKFQEEGYLSSRDTVDEGQRIGKAYFAYLEKGQSLAAYLETNKRMQPQVEIYAPDGKKMVERTDNRVFIGYSTGAKVAAEETGVYKVIVTNPRGNLKGEFRLGLTLEGGAVPLAHRLPLPFPPQPVVVDEPLKTAPVNLPDPVKATAVALPFDKEGRFIPRQLIWTADAKTVFLVNDAGDLLRINTDKWILEKKLSGQKRIHQLLAAKEGLVALIANSEIWLIDPQSLTVINQFETPAAEVMAAVPASSQVLFAVSHQMGDNSAIYGDKKVKVVALDLTRGILTPQRKLDHVHAYSLTMSPDGEKMTAAYHLYDHLDGSFSVMGKEDGAFRTFNHTTVPTHQGLRLTFSPDSTFIATYCEFGASVVSKAYAPYLLQVHHVREEVRKVTFPTPKTVPAVELKPGWKAYAFAFDLAKNYLLVQGDPNRLVFYDWEGKIKHDFPLGEKLGGSPLQAHNLFFDLVVHPEGGRALARFADRLVHVDYTALAAANIPPPKFKEPEPKVVDNPKPKKDAPLVYAKDPVTKGIVTYREVVLPPTYAPPQWDTFGNEVFHLSTKGLLRRIDVATFKQTEEKDLDILAAKMVSTPHGLIIATARSPGELLVVNPKTLEIFKRTPCPGGTNELTVARVAGLAFVTNVVGKHALIDLKTGKVLTEEIKNAPAKLKVLKNVTLSPDGQYLFALSGDTHYRFRWTGTDLLLEDARTVPSPAKQGYAFSVAVSPDSKWLALTCPDLPASIAKGKDTPKGKVFGIADWQGDSTHTFASSLTVPTFDTRGHFFARDSKGQIIVTTGLPTGGKTIELNWPFDSVRHIIPHPRRNAFLAILPEPKTSASRTYYVEWSGK